MTEKKLLVQICECFMELLDFNDYFHGILNQFCGHCCWKTCFFVSSRQFFIYSVKRLTQIQLILVSCRVSLKVCNCIHVSFSLLIWLKVYGAVFVKLIFIIDYSCHTLTHLKVIKECLLRILFLFPSYGLEKKLTI